MNSNQNLTKSISIYPILGVNFVGTLGFSIVLPFLIFLVLRFGGNALVYGLMGAAYSVFQFIGAPLLGKWSDVYGRRKILLLSQVGTLISWLVFFAALYLPANSLLQVDSNILGSFTLTLPLIILFLARSLDGITGGNVSVAQAYLSDITPEEKRNENFGKMAISANLGFVVGPALAGLIGSTEMGEALPILAAILISIIATFLILYKLPESKPCAVEQTSVYSNVKKVFGQEQKDCFQIQDQEKITFNKVLSLEKIPLILTVYFLTFLGFNLFYIAFPVYAVQDLNWELTDTGIYFSFLGILMALVQGPVLKKASQKFSEKLLILMGSLVLGISFFFFNSSNLFTIYLAAALLALGNGIMWPSVLSYLSKKAGEKYQGTVQGIAGSGGSIASIIGLVVGGILFSTFGSGIFIISAIIIFCVFLMSLKL